MRDTQFFEQALGLEKPWRVKAVKMDVAAKRVEIEVECGSGTAWAGGGQRLHVQGYEERQWRHLDTMQFETVIRARVPRVKYPDGRTEMVSVPWAERYARCTLLFERFAIEVFVACGHLRAGCELLGLDWSSGQRIMDRAVERGLLRREVEEVEQVGLDEKSFGRGQDYISVLSDLKRARVLEVRPGNDTQSGRALWQSMPEEQRARVQAAAMDMSAGFAAATRLDAPHVAIVYDKFHVSKLLNEAVDAVRRQEHRELGKEGESLLTGTRQLWLYNPLNLENARPEEFAKVGSAT